MSRRLNESRGYRAATLPGKRQTCGRQEAVLPQMHYGNIPDLPISKEDRVGSRERRAERIRIAHELHDTLLQSFQGLMLRLQALHEMLPPDLVDARSALESGLDRGDRAIQECRSAILNLRTSSNLVCDMQQLLLELISQVEEATCFGRAEKPEPRMYVVGRMRPLNTKVSEYLLRIVREALRNAFRHAAAATIDTTIVYGEDSLRVSVRDNGKGINPDFLRPGGRTGHWGLIGMREFAMRISASLKIIANTGSGTTVLVVVPRCVAYEVGYLDRESYSVLSGVTND